LDAPVAEWSYIECRRGDELLEIVSTTEGSIRDRKVVLQKQKSYLEVCLLYREKPFDCLIAYLDGDNLMKHETFEIEPEKVRPIESLTTVTEPIRTNSLDFNEKLRELYSELTLKRSTWHLKLELDKDIKVEVLRAGKRFTLVSFGESGPELVDGDFIFTLDPQVKRFVIPMELVWRNFHKYKGKAHLAVFELVRADFHRIPNMFYKRPISNSISLNDVPRMTDISATFTSPLGIPLPQDEWSLDYGVPTRSEDA
jgi:hypothetical protein